MLSLVAPMLALYEGAVIAVWFIEKKRAAKQPA
jgi:Sec-independent protein secretion pathway component TatC